MEGESASLTCISVSSDSGAPFMFYRHGESLSVTDGGRLWAMLRIDNISKRDSGSYTCRDWKIAAGTKVQSDHSKVVDIIVTGKC